MTRFSKTLLVVAVTAFLSLACTASADRTIAEQQQDYQDLVDRIMTSLYQTYPSARGAVAGAYGYAAFGTTSTKIAIFGTGHGRGIAVENATGNKYYMDMFEADIGLGFGIQECSLIFVFDNWDAFGSFVNNGWDFGGQANATVSDSVSGGSLYSGAISVAPHVWIYQLAGKGFDISATLKGSKFTLNKTLNQPAAGTGD
ncbi:MAG: hypothetical protein N3A57_04135 [Negativicutes bacterium]|nr:hypothetical protein [Negativicutes bacterium]